MNATWLFFVSMGFPAAPGVGPEYSLLPKDREIR